MSEPAITREDGPTKGRYVARVDGIDAEAELTYSRAGPKLIIADHTEVPDVFRGKGLGRLLATCSARSLTPSARSTPNGRMFSRTEPDAVDR